MDLDKARLASTIIMQGEHGRGTVMAIARVHGTMMTGGNYIQLKGE